MYCNAVETHDWFTYHLRVVAEPMPPGLPSCPATIPAQQLIASHRVTLCCLCRGTSDPVSVSLVVPISAMAPRLSGALGSSSLFSSYRVSSAASFYPRAERGQGRRAHLCHRYLYLYRSLAGS